MKVEFLDLAQKELDDTFDYYEYQQSIKKEKTLYSSLLLPIYIASQTIGLRELLDDAVILKTRY